MLPWIRGISDTLRSTDGAAWYRADTSAIGLFRYHNQSEDIKGLYFVEQVRTQERGFRVPLLGEGA